MRGKDELEKLRNNPNAARFGWDGTGIEVKTSQCADCVHRVRVGICKAFPDGIPIPILTNKVSHKTPYPGDNGIQFEKELGK